MDLTSFVHSMSVVGTIIDGLGVLAILLGVLLATIVFVRNAIVNGVNASYSPYRLSVGKAILLGLEFLVAGDIIRTVAVAPNVTNVLILGGIVLIRTFLSLALQLEIEGRFSWQKPVSSTPAAV